MARVGMNPATLAHLRDGVQAICRKLARDFRRPDDDWPICVLFVQTPGGVEIASVPGEMMLRGRDKDAVVDVMKTALSVYRRDGGGVFRFALLINAHGVSGPSPEVIARVQHEEMRVQDLPQAREFLWLVVGDAETEQHWQAEIRRDGRRPPRLGPWRDVGSESDHGLSGRFVGLNEALR